MPGEFGPGDFDDFPLCNWQRISGLPTRAVASKAVINGACEDFVSKVTLKNFRRKFIVWLNAETGRSE
jgi:hypothetical protein